MQLTYSQIYYKQNKSKVLAYHKKRYSRIKNDIQYKTKRREYSKLYWQKNKDKITKNKLEYLKKYYKLNKVKIDKRNRVYARNNIQKMRDNTRNYKLRHPQCVLWSSITGRCKRENLKINISKKDFYNWYLNAKKVCEYCGIEESKWGKLKDSFAKRLKRLQVDRVVPNKGYVKNNMVLACARCNITKSNFFSYEDMKKIGKIINAAR